MGVFSVSRGWMMTTVMAMIMRDSLMLLITARLFNQLAQREMQHINTHWQIGRKEALQLGTAQDREEKREEKNTVDSCHNVTSQEVRLHPQMSKNETHKPTQTIQNICISVCQFSYSQLKVEATKNKHNQQEIPEKKKMSQQSLHCLTDRWSFGGAVQKHLSN